MKNTKIGRIDYSNLITPPQKHERDTAKFFANRGLDIMFIRPSSIAGMHSPDFIMCGKYWETKSPILYGKSSFEDNFKKAELQSCNIIYDLRRICSRDREIYLKELRRRCSSRRVKNLLVIDWDGNLLTLKGDGVNIRI